MYTHTPHTQLTHTYSSTHNLLHPNPSPSLFSFLLSPCHLYLSFAACWKKLTCGVIWAFNFTRQGATARCGLSTAILSVIFLWPMASTLLLAECVPCWVHPVLHLVPLNPEGALCCDFARAAFLQELDYVPKLGYIGEWSSPSRMGRMGIYIPNIKIPIIGWTTITHQKNVQGPGSALCHPFNSVLCRRQDQEAEAQPTRFWICIVCTGASLLQLKYFPCNLSHG